MNLDLATNIIEALRAGIPTRDSTRHLVNSRSSLHTKIDGDLTKLVNHQTVPKGRLIQAGFGQGKTHELTSIEHSALDRGLAVSRITLNRQLSGQRLDHLYIKLAASIRTPRSHLCGLRHVLDQKNSSDLLASEILNVQRYSHPFPAIVLETFIQSSNQDRDLLYNAFIGAKVPMMEIKGKFKMYINTKFPKLPEPFKPTKHARAFFEVMSDTLKWCGYHGWVVLIDEIELILRLSKLDRMEAYMNLYWLLNWSSSQTFPIYTVGAVTPSLIQQCIDKRGSDGLSEQYFLPALARQKGNEKSADQLSQFFRCLEDNDLCPFIKQMDEGQLNDLLVKITKVHGLSYGWQPDLDVQSVIRSVGNNPVRLHIRALLETLDMQYLGDREFVPQITALEESSLNEDESYFEESDSTQLF